MNRWASYPIFYIASKPRQYCFVSEGVKTILFHLDNGCGTVFCDSSQTLKLLPRLESFSVVIRSIASIRLINYKGHIHHHPFLDTPKDRVINVSMLQLLPATHLHITTFPLETLFRLLAHLFYYFGIGPKVGLSPAGFLGQLSTSGSAWIVWVQVGLNCHPTLFHLHATKLVRYQGYLLVPTMTSGISSISQDQIAYSHLSTALQID